MVYSSHLLISDRDLTVAFLTYLDVRAAHGIRRPLGFDLINHIVVGKRQVLDNVRRSQSVNTRSRSSPLANGRCADSVERGATAER